MKRRSDPRFLLTICLFLFGLFLLPQCTREEKVPLATRAPDFTLQTLNGGEITLSKLRGQVVLLDFWATWCAPCREAIPHLIHLQKTYQEKGFQVIGMNVDKTDVEAVRRYVRSMDILYPIALTPEEVSRKYGVTALPTTLIIDREGRIRQKFVGFTSEISREITSLIAELIQEKT